MVLVAVIYVFQVLTDTVVNYIHSFPAQKEGNVLVNQIVCNWNNVTTACP